MKKNEFIEIVKRFRKSEKKFSLIQMVIIVSVMLAVVEFKDYIKIPFKNNIELFNIVFVFVFLSFLTINLVVIFYRAFTRPKKYGLICKYCNKQYQDQWFPYIIASEHCPFCNKRIIDDESQENII